MSEKLQALVSRLKLQHTMVLEEPTAITTTTPNNTDMTIVKKATPGKQEKPLKDKLAKTKDKSKKDKDRKSIKYLNTSHICQSILVLSRVNFIYKYILLLFFRYMFMHPLSIFKKSDSRIESFMTVVDQHKEFFVKCPQIDSYLVGMAFDYLQRTKPSIAPTQYSPNLLFCCLYLAWVCKKPHFIACPYSH
jgi:hypothetical protein